MQATLHTQRPNLLPDAKIWLDETEIREVCQQTGIGRKQAYKILSGRSANWLFLDKVIDRILSKKSKFDQAKAMTEHLKNFQKSQAK